MSVIEIAVKKRWRRVCVRCSWPVPEGHHIATMMEAHWALKHQGWIDGDDEAWSTEAWSGEVELTICRGDMRIRELGEPGWYYLT